MKNYLGTSTKKFTVKAILYLLFFLSLKTFAQDVDIYKHSKNENFNLPRIPAQMTYEEFKLLNTDLRMQDMLIGMILPGHVHFKIQEKKTGYYLVGGRSLGYAGLLYLSAKDQSVWKILLKKQAGLDYNLQTGDVIVAYTSVFLILGTYLYDWIHGKYLLEEKQNRIRYKYAPRGVEVGFTPVSHNGNYYPGISLKVSF